MQMIHDRMRWVLRGTLYHMTFQSKGVRKTNMHVLQWIWSILINLPLATALAIMAAILNFSKFKNFVNGQKIMFTIISSSLLLPRLPKCPSCPTNVIQMDHATWAIWATIKKYSFKLHKLTPPPPQKKKKKKKKRRKKKDEKNPTRSRPGRHITVCLKYQLYIKHMWRFTLCVTHWVQQVSLITISRPGDM